MYTAFCPNIIYKWLGKCYYHHIISNNLIVNVNNVLIVGFMSGWYIIYEVDINPSAFKCVLKYAYCNNG